MKTFSQLKTDLLEHVLSIGFNPEHASFREKHRQEIHDILRGSYKNVEGGYSGLGHGTEAESAAIHDDISKHNIKATTRNGKVTAVRIYKNLHGRKMIAAGTDGTTQGKSDFTKTGMEDNEQHRSWAEVSGKMETISDRMGVPSVPNDRAKELTGKGDAVPHKDGIHYDRKIGNDIHTKTIKGYPQ